MSLINNELKKILVCPLDKGPLEENQEKSFLRCTVCGKTYPVRDSVPVMLPENKNDNPRKKPEKSGGRQ